MANKQPLLSIGLIFKNEIRCIERCMKSLEPLRKAIPCELVMADTGSTDGSREVAEQYADILFDFPWINDFAAARNAVMDRCSGEWYFSVDCDEWLDENFSELTAFLKNAKKRKLASEAAAVTIRNYKTKDLNLEYSMDFLGVRLLKRTPKIRYEGAIHEEWTHADGRRLQAQSLKNVILHHDGYVVMEGAWGPEKIERNSALLKEKLTHDPTNLATLLQCIESSSGKEEDYIRQALEEARAHKEHHRAIPAIYRYAVGMAVEQKLPEAEEWIAEAEERYPDSAFTRIDVAYQAVIYYWNKSDYAACIRWSEMYMDYLPCFRKGTKDLEAQSTSVVLRSSPVWERTVRIIAAGAYMNQENQEPQKARNALDKIDFCAMDVGQMENLFSVIQGLQLMTEEDSTSLAASLWVGISEPKPNHKAAEVRQKAFFRLGTKFFESRNQANEASRTNFRRYSWTFFRGLPNELGIAADVMSCEDPQEILQLLEKVEKWAKLPIQALDHALVKGAAFPLPGRPLKIEEADMLAARLVLNRPTTVRNLATKAAAGGLKDFQETSWARALVLAAIRGCQWKSLSEDMSLCRAFTQIESAFLRLCYAPAVLQKENLPVLPPLHRFGWYCVQAFEMLAAGDAVGYVRLLKDGLLTYEAGRPMVKFLTDNTEELQAVLAPPPSEELRELADKMRDMLALLGPDSPMAAAIRQSADYQQLAYLIEGTAAPVIGGLAQ